jgi:hypothetical protein
VEADGWLPPCVCRVGADCEKDRDIGGPGVRNLGIHSERDGGFGGNCAGARGVAVSRTRSRTRSHELVSRTCSRLRSTRTRDETRRFQYPEVSGFGFRVSGVGCRVSGFGCRVSGVGNLRISGCGLMHGCIRLFHADALCLCFRELVSRTRAAGLCMGVFGFSMRMHYASPCMSSVACRVSFRG